MYQSSRAATVLLCLTFLSACAAPGQSAQDFSPAVPMPSLQASPDMSVNRIAFGSCFSQEKSGAIFGKIQAEQPDLFVFLGDNVYAEDESPDPKLTSLREAYGKLAQVPASPMPPSPPPAPSWSAARRPGAPTWW